MSMNLKQLRTTQKELNRMWARCYRNGAGNDLLCAIEAAQTVTQNEIDYIIEAVLDAQTEQA